MIHEFAGNAAHLLSYVLLPPYYAAYAIAKKAQRWVIPTANCNAKQNLDQIDILVEGYPHSGNTFIAGNFEAGIRIAAYCHRQWAIHEGLKYDKKIVVLVRHPLECLRSRYTRSVYRRGNYAFTLHPVIVLITWLAYYNYVWKNRANLLILPFELIVDHYDVVRKMVVNYSNMSLKEVPDTRMQNGLGMDYVEPKLSWLGTRTLRRAIALYEVLLARAKSQCVPELAGDGSSHISPAS